MQHHRLFTLLHLGEVMSQRNTDENKEANDSARVAFVLPNLNVGGAQTVACEVASRLAKQGHQVSMILLNHSLDRAVNFPDESVQMYTANAKHRAGLHLSREILLSGQYLRIKPRQFPDRGSTIDSLEPFRRLHRKFGHPLVLTAPAISTVRRLIRYLRRSIGGLRRLLSATSPSLGLAGLFHPEFRTMLRLRKTLQDLDVDAAVSFLTNTNVLAIFASRGQSWRLVISERNDPARQKVRWPTRVLRKRWYREADVVSANSNIDDGVSQTFLGVQSTTYLPNPVSLDISIAQRAEVPVISFVGRLVPQKNVDLLIRACQPLMMTGIVGRLDIVGDGSERESLIELANTLGIGSRVEFHGFHDNPWKFVSGAWCLVLPSDFEGTPNSALEALARGIPVICASGSPGPSELVRQVDARLIFTEGSRVDLTRALALVCSESFTERDISSECQAAVRLFEWESIQTIWLQALGRRGVAEQDL